MTGDPTKLKKLKEVGQPGVLFRTARQPESSRLYVGCSDFKIRVIDPMEKKPEAQEWEGHTSYVSGLVLAGDTIISGGYDGQLIWWKAESGEQIRATDAHKKWIRNLALSPDGKVLASVADDMVCRLWEASSGKLLHELKGHAAITPQHFPSMLYAVAFSPDNQWVATGDKLGKVVVWNVSSGKEETQLEAPVMYTWDPKARIHSIGGIRSLAFSPDGALLAVGGMGKVGNIDHLGGPSRVEVFDWKKNERKLEISENGHKGLVEQLVFEKDGKWLLAAGGDNAGFLQFFNLENGKAIKQEKAPMHLHDLSFANDYQRLYGVGHGKIAVWDL